MRGEISLQETSTKQKSEAKRGNDVNRRYYTKQNAVRLESVRVL